MSNVIKNLTRLSQLWGTRKAGGSVKYRRAKACNFPTVRLNLQSPVTQYTQNDVQFYRVLPVIIIPPENDFSALSSRGDSTLR